MVSKSESRTSSLEGIGVSGLVFETILRFGFAYVSDSLPVFSELLDSFELEKSDFDLDSCDGRSSFSSRLLAGRFFDGSVILPVAGFRPNSEIIGKFRKLKKFYGHFVKRQK